MATTSQQQRSAEIGAVHTGVKHSPHKQQRQQNQSSSGGIQSHNSSSLTNNHTGSGGGKSSPPTTVQFNQIRLQSHVLELIQTLSLDYDQLSPVGVRQKLRQLVTAEQDARLSREAYLNEILQQRVAEEHARYQQQFEQIRVGFELDTIKFEKVLKDRAQGVIKSLQIKQLDRLIDMVGQIRQIHNLHGGPNSADAHQPQSKMRANCQETQDKLQSLITHIDGLMAELVSEDANSNTNILDQFNNIASQNELERNQGRTPFNADLKDQVLHLQQQSSNGVVATNKRVNSHGVVAGHQNGNYAMGLGAATSYGGVTSGDMPITNGSNFLSPNTTPSQEFPQPAEATLSNPQIQNIHRSNTTAANQFVQPGSKRPRFVYDLPIDFPFNEACIEKSLSNDLANSGLKSGSNGNGTHSQRTTSNHDVNPEDVLRTFTNSLHSGGTLGAIHDSLTYYKEALASKEWSNLSPSNAYQNFMWKKNLVGEIQKLAKEISRIPTEEAKILADLSKSHLSQEGSKRQFHSNQHMLRAGANQQPFSSGALGQAPPPGMTTAEAISKGLGFIGNNESSILMDLNRASIVAAQKEAEELKQKAKRIVDDSATRLEPVVKSFTDAPLNQHLMQAQNPRNNSSSGGNQSSADQRFIQYQQQPSSSLPDSQGLFPDRTNGDSSQNMIPMMYENLHHINHGHRETPNESVLRDSCVMYGDVPNTESKKPDQSSGIKKSPAKNFPHLNYHASNERSQLSEDDEESITDELLPDHNGSAHNNNSNNAQQPGQNRQTLIGQALQSRITSGHRRHGSVVVGEHTIQDNAIEAPQLMHRPGAKKGRELLNVYAERRSIQHEHDELSPKQLRNESLSVQRSSIAAKRKGQQMGFFSNDAAATFTDMELEQIEKAQNFQQTASFAPQNATHWWLEDGHETSQNQVLFQQTAGPGMNNMRTQLASKLKSSRRRGTQSVNSQHANFASQNLGSTNVSAQGGGALGMQVNSRFQNLSNNALDNKGRAIKQQHANQDQTSGNLYDELSRVAEYQSSRSVLDGHSTKQLRNAQQSNLNRTMQVKKKSGNQGRDNTARNHNEQHTITGSNGGPPQGYNRENISKSVLTNADRASPIPCSVSAAGAKIGKMNIKKTQIKLVGGIQNKRSSIQMSGQTSTGGGAQSKSQSREGRIKVKLVSTKNNTSSQAPTPVGVKEKSQSGVSDQNVSRFSSVGGGVVSANTSQSPRMSRNQRVQMATGPSKSSQGQNIPTGILQNQRQREFSPQHANAQQFGGVIPQKSTAYTNKIPFKSNNNNNSHAKREEAGSVNTGTSHIRNNFFSEQNPIQNIEGGLNDQAQDQQPNNNNNADCQAAARQLQNASHLSAPIQSSTKQSSNQPQLKIRRNRKTTRRMLTPTIEDSVQQQEQRNQNQPVTDSFDKYDNDDGHQANGLKNNDVHGDDAHSDDQEEAELHFNEIARNLRSVSQNQNNNQGGNSHGNTGTNVFIRKGSYHQNNQQQQNQVLPYGSTNTDGNGSGSEAAGQGSGQAKSRQGTFVRQYKASSKSRQGEDLSQSFGTERVSFHRSALMSNQSNTRKSNMTQDQSAGQSVPTGYKRPAGSVAKQANGQNAVTVRVKSHSQPPFANEQDQQHSHAAAGAQDNSLNEPRIIPPPTELLAMTDEQRQETSSTPGQMSGGGSVTVNGKRPVVKMTAINFIGPGSSKEQQPQVSNFATAQPQPTNSGNTSNVINTGQFSFHHPQQPSQGKHGKKASISAQLKASPYMTQQKVPGSISGTGQSQAQATAASKRVIHLKRPSTNFQMQSSNQPSLVGKNAFAQRAASRVENSEKNHELSFQHNANNGQTSGASAISAIQRPTTQIRIGKKTSVGGTQQTQVVIGASRTNGNFLRPPSDMSNDGDNSYM